MIILSALIFFKGLAQFILRWMKAVFLKEATCNSSVIALVALDCGREIDNNAIQLKTGHHIANTLTYTGY